MSIITRIIAAIKSPAFVVAKDAEATQAHSMARNGDANGLPLARQRPAP